MSQDIIHIINERGLLLQKELFDFLMRFDDARSAKDFLDTLEYASGQKMITLSSLGPRVDYVIRKIELLSNELKKLAQTLFSSITPVQVSQVKPAAVDKDSAPPYKLFYADTKNYKKIDVTDFVGHFRSRYHQLQRILMQRPDLQGLVSLNKIPKDKQRFSFIGIVREKRVTANHNLIITFEDLTGSVKALVKVDSESHSKAKELQLDDVVGVRGTGGSDFVYVYDIVFPDAFREKTRFNQDICVAFVSDVHAGSQKHLGKEFQNFVNWLNTDTTIAPKIQYIFFVGDNVDGVGVFPGQERLLALRGLKDQYSLLASYLAQIPKHITMFMCPGQHDSVRVAEPQPIIDDFYGKPLYDISNLVLVPNPTLVKLIEQEKEFRVLMYHGASIHHFINEIEELRVLKAHKCPAKAVVHMLKRRHLAPTHGVSPGIIYVPNAHHDPLVIQEVPDVLCTGEVHRLDIENYNGTLILTGSCWQAQTEFEEKVGNVPDPCKVPVLNLKTRELRILDFTT